MIAMPSRAGLDSVSAPPAEQEGKGKGKPKPRAKPKPRPEQPEKIPKAKTPEQEAKLAAWLQLQIL